MKRDITKEMSDMLRPVSSNMRVTWATMNLSCNREKVWKCIQRKLEIGNSYPQLICARIPARFNQNKFPDVIDKTGLGDTYLGFLWASAVQFLHHISYFG